ncbi:stage VI sporulation protein F [Aquibacillus albus]|uniref:Stage VI sporulation protein F n=1 Tax=Aquibacillus albus TaxID=1168171 RepID=A0ABS2N5P8_9BACI|nr:stage VI sporulation protein F [Aquibacillus albus]MBM7573210.1 hypothetical protein [Aquibacillus albus]
MNQDFLKNIEKKTGVDMRKVMQLANSLNGKDLQDEKTVRNLVKQVSSLAGKRVNKQTEDKIVEMIINKKVNESTVKKMMK